MPLGTLAAVSLGLGAAGALTRGIGGAIAAKQSFTDEQQRELDRLLRRRASGNLGLSPREREQLEAQAKSQQSGALRDAQATALQSAAAQGAGGTGVSGRDVFLRELAGQSAVQQAAQQTAAATAEADMMAKEAQKQRISELDAAKAGRKAGMISALTGGAADMLGVGMQAVGTADQRAFELELAKTQLPVKSIDDLVTEADVVANNKYLQRLGEPAVRPRL